MSLLAAYHCDDIGSSTLTDVSGNGFHATLTGSAAVQAAAGRHDGGLAKTGSAMPVLPAGLLAVAQSDDRSLMWDAKGTGLTTWHIRFQDDGINSGTWGGLNISGQMAVQARRASDLSLLTRPGATAPSGTDWTNYCATYDRESGDCMIYRNGAWAATQSFADGTQLSTAADRIDLMEWSGTGVASIDNVRFFDEALDPATVAALAGTPVLAAAGYRSDQFFAFFGGAA